MKEKILLTSAGFCLLATTLASSNVLLIHSERLLSVSFFLGLTSFSLFLVGMAYPKSN